LRHSARRRATITPRKQPRQARARETVEAILQAATYILQKAGYEAMTTNQIADRAGVNIASLYQYFPNKQAILAELARRHVNEARGRLATTLVGLRTKRRVSLRDAVRAMIGATCAEHAIDPQLHEIFTIWGPRVGLPHVTTEVDATIEVESQVWVESMAGALPDPELALWIARTTIHAVVHHAFVERPEIAAMPELAAELARLLVPFLAPRRARGSGRGLRRRR
jgi:AcrR family transcriptional regulator